MPSLAKAKGVGRIGELLTGSRAKTLADRAQHLEDRVGKTRETATRFIKNYDGAQRSGESALGHKSRLEGAAYRAGDAVGRVREAAERAGNAARGEKTKSTLTRVGAGVGAVGAGAAGYEHFKKKAASILDELEKLGAVSPDQARRALDQLDALEQNKPDARAVARYGISGALTGAGISALGNIIEKKPIGGLRGVGAMAMKGALGAGAVPLLQSHLDRRAQMGTLQQFIAQPEAKVAAEKDSGFLDTVKNIAMTDLGGPKGFLQPAARAAANVGKKVAPAAANVTRRAAGGAYDVSSMARQMGIT